MNISFVVDRRSSSHSYQSDDVHVGIHTRPNRDEVIEILPFAIFIDEQNNRSVVIVKSVQFPSQRNSDRRR